MAIERMKTERFYRLYMVLRCTPDDIPDWMVYALYRHGRMPNDIWYGE